jgi:hypothetical protein
MRFGFFLGVSTLDICCCKVSEDESASGTAMVGLARLVSSSVTNPASVVEVEGVAGASSAAGVKERCDVANVGVLCL